MILGITIKRGSWDYGLILDHSISLPSMNLNLTIILSTIIIQQANFTVLAEDRQVFENKMENLINFFAEEVVTMVDNEH